MNLISNIAQSLFGFNLEVVLAVLVIVVGLIIIGRASVVIVNQFERGMVERWGAYQKTVDPGLHFIVPVMQNVFRINMREQVIDVPPQEIITEDNVIVYVDAVVYYQIMDPKRSRYEVEDFELAIVKLAQTTLRNLVGEMSLNMALTSRERINLDLRKILDEATDKWGTKVNRIEVQRINPPADIQEAMHKQKTAEQERRQYRLLATGKKEAAGQDREGTIMKAEGEVKSIELVAHAQAEAIKVVSEAANKYFHENAQLNKKLDVIKDTFSEQTKIIVPSNSEILNVLGLDGAQVIPVKTDGTSKEE